MYGVLVKIYTCMTIDINFCCCTPVIDYSICNTAADIMRMLAEYIGVRGNIRSPYKHIPSGTFQGPLCLYSIPCLIITSLHRLLLMRMRIASFRGESWESSTPSLPQFC